MAGQRSCFYKNQWKLFLINRNASTKNFKQQRNLHFSYLGLADKLFIIFLCTEIILAFFHCRGNFPLSKQDLYIICNGLKTEKPHNFDILILISSWPWDLLESKLFIAINMSSAENGIEYRTLSVFFIISDGKELSLFISEHWFVKKEWIISAFTLKSVTNLFSWNIDRMHGIF